MYLGYNTNGLAFHEPFEAIQLLAEIGYRAIGLTIDHGLLSPRDAAWRKQAERVKESLERYQFRSVMETGARFLLDFRQKHEPTLMSARRDDRERRVEFLCHAVDVARELGSDAVSLWSGVLRDGISREAGLRRLAEGLKLVLAYADQRQVVLAFEPEPGMFIATMDQCEQLFDQLGAPQLRLTLDVGHLQCQGELPLADWICRWGERLANVHLEDMRRGVHEHLMFGEGEIDFPSVIQAFSDCEYRGGIYVELSRHSHDAPRIAQQAFEYLEPLIRKATI
jgi:L-ribulose-5-phosphate 3-epimerase